MLSRDNTSSIIFTQRKKQIYLSNFNIHIRIVINFGIPTRLYEYNITTFHVLFYYILPIYYSHKT